MSIPNVPERDYLHSRILDIHKHSDYAEVNDFVNSIYDNHFKNYYDNNEKQKVNHSIRKKHLKLLLLDLYVSWSNDPNLNIAVHMSKNSYSNGSVTHRGKTRYNELNIKDTVIQIVKRLQDIGFIGLKNGWKDETTNRSYVTRIWSQPRLTLLFEKVLFHEFDISYRDNREVIILRDKKKHDINYTDTSTIVSMRRTVNKYNALIHRTFIDIPGCDKPSIVISPGRKQKNNKEVKVSIAQSDKFVRKVFNNGSWKDGGRYNGGWWQRLEEPHRRNICINNEPIVEIDHSAIHTILAYAEKNINYWSTTPKDPYDVLLPNIEDDTIENIDLEDARTVVKHLFLMSLNAVDETKSFQAFVNQWDYKKHPYKGVFTHKYLRAVLNNIKNEHYAISDMFCSGVGIKLMSKKSQMVDYIIQNFVDDNTPILTVHDSFLVPLSQKIRLQNLMQEACYEATNNTEIKVKPNDATVNTKLEEPHHQDGLDYNNLLVNADELNAADGYSLRLKRHKAYYTLTD